MIALTHASAGRAAFLEGMRDLGYVEGRDLLVEARFADSQAERLPGLAKELLGLKVDGPGDRRPGRQRGATERNLHWLVRHRRRSEPETARAAQGRSAEIVQGRRVVESEQRVASGPNNTADIGAPEDRSTGRAGRGRCGGGDRDWLRLADSGARPTPSCCSATRSLRNSCKRSRAALKHRMPSVLILRE